VDIGAAHSVKDLNKVILPNYEIILNAVKVTYVTLIERCQEGKKERATLPMLAVLWHFTSFRKVLKCHLLEEGSSGSIQQIGEQAKAKGC
jgi:hypothetical protein